MRDARVEAERWLAAAREDLEYARYAAAGGHHAPACFFAQQAAEKAIKGVHYLHGARAVIGHNLRALIDHLDPRDASLDTLLDVARELDLFYVPTRYPNGLDAGTPGQAFSKPQSERALELAARFIDAVTRLLGC
jgi:HEPN domain-containing protein